MNSMTILHRRVLSVMLSFLLNVVEYEDSNKMTNYNLAMAFAPCLMWCQNETKLEILNIGLCIKFVSLMLKHYTTLFPNQSYKHFLNNEKQETNFDEMFEPQSSDIRYEYQDESNDELEFTIESILTNVDHDAVHKH